MNQQTPDRQRRTAPITTATRSHSQSSNTTPVALPTGPSSTLCTDWSAALSPDLDRPLSFSEPTLKFPKPQGSSHLANWISNSDPDIMRVTTISTAPDTDVGLSDSTYELISTDAESPACDLGSDCSRADDDQSFPDTEHTCEDVEDVDQPSEPESEEEETARGSSSAAGDKSVLTGADSVLSLASTSVPGDEVLRARKSSIEYTEQSLELPSVMTPDEKKPAAWRRAWGRVHSAILTPVPYEPYVIAFVALVLSVVLFRASYAAPPSPDNAPSLPAASKIDSMTIINITAPSTTAPVATKPSAAFSSAVIPFVGLGFETPSAKNFCSAELTESRDVLLRIPISTKTSWLAQDSIAISVHRGESQVGIKSSFFSTNDGILIEIPWWDRHGIVSVSVLTSRRPKINETFQLDFGNTVTAVFGAAQGLGERLGGMAVSICNDFIELSQQLIEEAARTLASATSAFMNSARSFSSSLSRQLNDIQDNLSVQMRTARVVGAELGQEATIALTRAQVISRLWYFRLVNKHDEYDEYQRKATVFMATQRESADRERRERRSTTSSVPMTGKCRGLARWTNRCPNAA